MRTKLAHLLILASLVGVAFSAMVPVADAGCLINAGYCGKGCNYKINAGSCGSGCSGLINVGSCLVGGQPVCSDEVVAQVLPCDDVNSQPWQFNCPHSSPHAHTYGTGGTVGQRSQTAATDGGAGAVTVSDGNAADCDGDGFPGDFDGDYETGTGGAFFGYGPWAHESTCGYNLALHGGFVTVIDVTFGSDVWFIVGADDTSGPQITVDPVDGSTSCSTDGSITPGDPTTDPTADADDCFSDPQHGSGSNFCGGGGDGGYWVFLHGVLVSEGAGGFGASNSPTTGTITA